MNLFGIRLVGFNPENGQKLLLTISIILVLVLLKSIVSLLFRKIFPHKKNVKLRFWSRQGINLTFAFLMLIGVLSIWFDDPTRLTTGLGLVSAGLAFALQKVVTSFAGYLVIMRGNTFSVGERITMGGIRGDVIALGFLQTTIMEMGQPPSVQGANPAMWIRGRQFTGRIVTVTNDKIFENPVFNYTRDFPFIWEEIALPIKYTADRNYVEKMMISIVQKHTEAIHAESQRLAPELERRYGIKTEDVLPKVFYRLTDNWLELAVRFILPEHGIRDIKDQIAREILTELDKKKIEIASATFEVVGIPTLQFEAASFPRENTEQDRDLRS